MPPFRATFAARFARAGLAALPLLAAPAHAEEAEARHRLFVADQAAGRITVIDLAEGGGRWSFDIGGPARLYPLAGGSVIAAVQSDGDRVQFLDSGMTLSDHGDHADLEVADPALLEGDLTGAYPVHVVSHGGETAINFDQAGYAAILDDRDLAEGRIAPVTFPQARAHHGFVAGFGEVMLGSVASDAPASAEGSVPRLGLAAFHRDGTAAGPVQTCTAIHGEAVSGTMLAAGCREGVLTAMVEGDSVAYRMLPYPADFPEGTTGTLHGGRAMQIFLGNHGADGLVVIDPEAEPHMRRIALPFRRVDFGLDPVDPATGWALTEDGSLHGIDLLQATVTDSLRVTGPYSMDGHWNDPRPRLAMTGDEVLVSDPAAEAVHRVAVDGLRLTGTIGVEGLPFNMTLAGGSGVAH
ncbi:metallochaperone AztD [Frigidibacter oleivorans]|uniref:metallochaperone AztD n=1 Tax=Frigidibacter oleivorans TaxID=2487129 RepID=UPI000F8E9605|nr:metallochaperone AztD [Frigidibacter oleivorans]